MGSEAPVIDSIEPLTGRVDDIMTISGSGFSYVEASNIVSFAGIPAGVIESTDTELKVRIPFISDRNARKIRVTLAGSTVQSEQSFVYNR